MKSFLKDKKMWGYIIDTLHKLMNENDEKYAKLLDGWEVRNSKIITQINNSTETSVGMQSAKYEIAKKIWNIWKDCIHNPIL